MIYLERAYDQPKEIDVPRFLVDRLWPRGVRKDALAYDEWLKDVAPTNELRQWFGHDTGRWDEFVSRYFEELDAKPRSWRPLVDAARCGDIVLIYGARDRTHNNAAALKEYIETKLLSP